MGDGTDQPAGGESFRQPDVTGTLTDVSDTPRGVPPPHAPALTANNLRLMEAQQPPTMGGALLRGAAENLPTIQRDPSSSTADVRQIYSNRPRPVSEEAIAAAVAGSRPLSYAEEVAMSQPAPLPNQLPLTPPHARGEPDVGPSLPSPHTIPAGWVHPQPGELSAPLRVPDEIVLSSRPPDPARSFPAAPTRPASAAAGTSVIEAELTSRVPSSVTAPERTHHVPNSTRAERGATHPYGGESGWAGDDRATLEAETRRQAELREAELRAQLPRDREATLHEAEGRLSEAALLHEAVLMRHDAELLRQAADRHGAELEDARFRRQAELEDAELREMQRHHEAPPHEGRLHQAELALLSSQGRWGGSGSRFLGTASGCAFPAGLHRARACACVLIYHSFVLFPSRLDSLWPQLREGGCRLDIPREQLAGRARAQASAAEAHVAAPHVLEHERRIHPSRPPPRQVPLAAARSGPTSLRCLKRCLVCARAEPCRVGYPPEPAGTVPSIYTPCMLGLSHRCRARGSGGEACTLGGRGGARGDAGRHTAAAGGPHLLGGADAAGALLAAQEHVGPRAVSGSHWKDWVWHWAGGLRRASCSSIYRYP